MPTSGLPGNELLSTGGSSIERLCFIAVRGSVAVAAEAVPNTAAGRGRAVFQAVPAVSEGQSGGRIPPRTYGVWEFLAVFGNVWRY